MVPDEVRLGVVPVELVVEHAPVKFTFKLLPSLAQHHHLVLLRLLWLAWFDVAVVVGVV